MRAVLTLPAFRLLFVGLAASMVGNALLLPVFAIWVKSLTGSNGAAGLVTLFTAVPYALAPLGGWLVDRFRRRSFLVAANVASALTLLPLFLVHDTGDVRRSDQRFRALLATDNPSPNPTTRGWGRSPHIGGSRGSSPWDK